MFTRFYSEKNCARGFQFEVSIDFDRLEQAYLLARNLTQDPQMPDADRVCCHFIALLIREASGDAAEAWGTSDLTPAFPHSSE